MPARQLPRRDKGVALLLLFDCEKVKLFNDTRLLKYCHVAPMSYYYEYFAIRRRSVGFASPLLQM